MTGIATRLVDCYFFSADSGFVFGGLGQFGSSKDLVLFTSNGGASWETKFISFPMAGSEACWKINFINKENAFASLNHQGDSLTYLKTSDGGASWTRKAYQISSSTFTQGIGFVNETTGWLGGEASATYETTDAGITWHNNTFGLRAQNLASREDLG
jgi:photosystem II stability/assembly factor-like uncharacterized protein